MTVQKQVAIGGVLALLLALPMLIMVIQRFRSHEPLALAAVSRCPQVAQALGEPIARTYPSHCTSESGGFCIELRGPKGRGELHWRLSDGHLAAVSLRLAEVTLNLNGCAGVK